MFKRLFFLILPLILAAALYFYAPALDHLSELRQSLLGLLPYAALPLALGLALRFNRSRVFFLALSLAAAFLAMRWDPRGDGGAARDVMLLVSIFLPLNVLLLSVLSERGIMTPNGYARFAVVGLQLGLGFWLSMQLTQDWTTLLTTPWISQGWLAETPIAHPALLLWVGAAAWLIAQLFIRPTVMSCCLFSTLVLAILPFWLGASPLMTAVAFGLAGMALSVAVVQESYSMAFYDELTGLPGRRAMREAMAGLGSRYAIAMLDVDHFKKFNDTYGHDTGDQVLRMVAQNVRSVSGGGRPARYGGEEFAIIFPNRDLEEVLPHLEVVRAKIENTPFHIRGKNRPRKAPEKRPKKKPAGKTVTVTISIGVAQKTDKNTTPEAVMKAADKALYRAKQKGRNRVCK